MEPIQAMAIGGVGSRSVLEPLVRETVLGKLYLFSRSRPFTPFKRGWYLDPPKIDPPIIYFYVGSIILGPPYKQLG